jgi:5-methyltetrahydropteroyltriglutamate--homocysteine methyltransferase
METLVDDIGSFPLPTTVDRETYNKAYHLAREALTNGEDIIEDEFMRKNFYDVTIYSFRRKIETGLDVVNSPWHYDGIRQISDAVHKVMEKGTFVVDEKDAFLPEVRAIEKKAKSLSEEYGKKILLRVCMFGPMEQYLVEVGKNPYQDILEALAETIRRFAKNSILNNKYIETKVVSIDEPSFGLNNIQASSDVICGVLEKAFDFKGATRQIHLHSAAGVHDLLSVKNLDVLSFEYAASPGNIESVPKSMLEKADKQIRVGVSRTDIDAISAELYEKGIDKPSAEQLVETEEIIGKRYKLAKEKYGERMTFAGPDCGLGGWPNQESAVLLLERAAKAVKGNPNI